MAFLDFFRRKDQLLTDVADMVSFNLDDRDGTDKEHEELRDIYSHRSKPELAVLKDKIIADHPNQTFCYIDGWLDKPCEH